MDLVLANVASMLKALYSNPSYLAVFGTLTNSQKPRVWRKIAARKTVSLEANNSQKNREFERD